MASSFTEPRASLPLTVTNDSTWVLEITAAEYAVEQLFQAKRQVLLGDPHHEQVLWARHIERLRLIKRKMDAVCM